MKKAIKFIAIAYVIMGIAYLSYSYLTINSNPPNHNNTITGGKSLPDPMLAEKVNNKQIAEKDKKYVCGDNIQNSNYYIKEFVLPMSCSQPVGLAIDNTNNIWIAAVWTGQLLVFDSQSNSFVKNISLPNWLSQGSFGSIIWDMKFDKNGDLWFTDEMSNSIWKYFVKENKFEKYVIPTKDSYPVSMVFDSKDKVWFTEIFGKKLGFLDPIKVENNTTKGIKEFDLPKNVKFETLGPLSIGSVRNNNSINYANNSNERLWFSTVSYPYGGQIVKFDIFKENFTIYELGNTKSIPVSIIEDKNGILWTNDHASNIFLSIDTKTGTINQYSTSPASTRNSTTTLPYYNEYKDGKIWFNEHEGNAIASYDPENKTLIEYHIPTRNALWGNTSNPLKFAIDNDGSVWFTEWTENKIGVVKSDTMNQSPISLSVSKDQMVIDTINDKSDSLNISISSNTLNYTIDSKSLTNDSQYNTGNISMFVTSSISKSGKLVNLPNTLSKNQLQLSEIPFNKPFNITLDIHPNTTTNKVNVGDYALTISARYNNDITVSKIIDLIIR